MGDHSEEVIIGRNLNDEEPGKWKSGKSVLGRGNITWSAGLYPVCYVGDVWVYQTRAFVPSFAHSSLDRYLLSSTDVPGTVLGVGNVSFPHRSVPQSLFSELCVELSIPEKGTKCSFLKWSCYILGRLLRLRIHKKSTKPEYVYPFRCWIASGKFFWRSLKVNSIRVMLYN